jgi:hypothetical protein
MHPLVYLHRYHIRELCHRFRVHRLEVFGSAARGSDFDAKDSDTDFLVEFIPSAAGPSLTDFFGLQAELTRILGRPVDLVEVRAIRNPYIRASIDRSRELVYAA